MLMQPHLVGIAAALAARGWRLIECTADRLIAMDSHGLCVDYQRVYDETFDYTVSHPRGRWRWLRCVLYNAVR